MQKRFYRYKISMNMCPFRWITLREISTIVCFECTWRQRGMLFCSLMPRSLLFHWDNLLSAVSGPHLLMLLRETQSSRLYKITLLAGTE